MDRHYDERMQEKLDQLKEAGRPEPIRSDGAGALDLGPRDLRRDEENPDMIVPPATDHGLLPNLRFSFSDTHMDIKPGGWSREITKRELPVSDTFAMVDMNLSPVCVRCTPTSSRNSDSFWWGEPVSPPWMRWGGILSRTAGRERGGFFPRISPIPFRAWGKAASS